MKNINRQLVISSVEAYKLFEIELPKFAKKHKTKLLNITVEDADVYNYVRRYVNFISEIMPRKVYQKVLTKLRNGESINFIADHTSNTSIYIKDSAYQYLNDDAFNITINKLSGERAKIQHKIMSDSLRDNICDIAYNLEIKDNGPLFRSLAHYLKYKEFEKGEDRNFTIKTNGDMTYLPGNKETILSDNNKWSITGRQEIKYGKGIRKIFSSVYNMTEKDVEILSNKLTEKFKFCGEFKVVVGETITKYYHGRTYAPNSGTLNSSCMRGSECNEYFGIYEKNASMLIALNSDGYIMGRAILWDNVERNDNDVTIKFMDRIYGNDVAIEAFKTWAINNGYYHKAFQSYQDPEAVINPVTKCRENIDMTIRVTGKHPNYPYMDTFKSTDDDIENDEYIEISNNRMGDTIFEDTNGLVDSDDYVNIDGRRVHIDNACYVERIGDYFMSDDCVYTNEEEYDLVEDCVEINGEWYNRESDDIVWSEYEDEYILLDNAKRVDDVWYPYDADCLRYSEYLGETVHEDDVVYSEQENDYIPLDEAVECFISNDWILKENAIEIIKNERTYYANNSIYTEEELLTKIEE